MSAVTEAEAKAMFCPLTYSASKVRWSDDEDAAVREHGPWLCLGERCMGWRWGFEKTVRNERLGYCGMVGKPLR